MAGSPLPKSNELYAVKNRLKRLLSRDDELWRVGDETDKRMKLKATLASAT